MGILYHIGVLASKLRPAPPQYTDQQYREYHDGFATGYPLIGQPEYPAHDSEAYRRGVRLGRKAFEQAGSPHIQYEPPVEEPEHTGTHTCSNCGAALSWNGSTWLCPNCNGWFSGKRQQGTIMSIFHTISYVVVSRLFRPPQYTGEEMRQYQDGFATGYPLVGQPVYPVHESAAYRRGLRSGRKSFEQAGRPQIQYEAPETETHRQDLIHEIEQAIHEQGGAYLYTGGMVTIMLEQGRQETFNWNEDGGLEKSLQWLAERKCDECQEPHACKGGGL